jgi:hypothetical protein
VSDANIERGETDVKLSSTKEIDDQKKVEYYAASVAAWYETALEHDKSLLILSTGGIGLLITLLTTVGLGTAKALALYIYIGAIICFVISLISILFVFRGNKKYIEDILSNKNQNTDSSLSKLDTIAMYSFCIGVVFTAFIGISTAISSFTAKGNIMANETTKSTKNVCFTENFNGAEKLQSQLTEITATPSTTLTTDTTSTSKNVRFAESFNGAEKLQPQPTEISTTPSTTLTTGTTSTSKDSSDSEKL